MQTLQICTEKNNPHQPKGKGSTVHNIGKKGEWRKGGKRKKGKKKKQSQSFLTFFFFSGSSRYAADAKTKNQKKKKPKRPRCYCVRKAVHVYV